MTAEIWIIIQKLEEIGCYETARAIYQILQEGGDNRVQRI